MFKPMEIRTICRPSIMTNNNNKCKLTCNIVKFSNTLFIIYRSGKCFSFCMKLIMYSHIGDR